ncbi:hypothetical protein GCM10010151_43240 [Actinoallomurus spadix]|uniref:Uncharacterized protein n=1 Tax=Actinoallomurus spadix TaxID=79912 RepID=A0ABP3GPM6_9ACTN
MRSTRPGLFAGAPAVAGGGDAADPVEVVGVGVGVDVAVAVPGSRPSDAAVNSTTMAIAAPKW